MNGQDQISGSVERITFYNEENGYTVLRLRPDRRGMLPFKYASGNDALITVVGNLPEVNPGEWLKLTGRWGSHSQYGRQFQVELCEQSLPATSEGIKRYLGSGLIRGVGKVMAERIVNKFGEDTLEVIEQEPQRLLQVPGIGRKRVDGVIKAWEEQRAIKDVMIFLQSHGVSTNLATKIYKKYGDASLAIVQNTPYRLVQDVYGIGFKTADKIAQALGLAADDPGRIEAGIAYTLNRMAEEGHVYMPQEELEPEASEILGIEQAKITAVIDRLETSDFIKRETIRYEIGTGAAPAKRGAIARERPQPDGPPRLREAKRTYEVGRAEKSETSNAQRPERPDGGASSVLKEEKAVYLTPLYYSEVGLTRRIQRLIEHPTSRLTTLQPAVDSKHLTVNSKQFAGSDLQSLISNLQSPIRLASQQVQAIETAISNKVTILTGGPGTGKTTTLRALIGLLDGGGFTYALASPTGRAAKRLSEATGREAKTIHRLLEFKPGEGFGRHDENPINADMVIIDEASMLDLVLANNLLKAVSPDSHLLLVGDVDQLPSVGAGDVLGDLIDSGVAAVVRLQIIFRQAADSLIIHNAHRINQGQMPETRPDARDFFLFVKQDPAETAELVVDIVKNRVPHKFRLHPIDDIQVLAPMYNGSAGVRNLNELLQAALNPAHRQKPERKLSGRVFRVGDKVMQTVNNYDKNVYNGDIGRVTAMDLVQQTMTVSVDGMPVVYGFLEADELVHAFCISVHKSQGAEYPCVVMPVVIQHYMMLQRNLLYTAVTRAKKLVILAGTRRAIHVAVKNNKVTQRHTALDWRLKR